MLPAQLHPEAVAVVAVEHRTPVAAEPHMPWAAERPTRWAAEHPMSWAEEPPASWAVISVAAASGWAEAPTSVPLAWAADRVSAVHM